MFGTIRRHQTWLWAVIITLTVISFVIYFSPYSRMNSGGGRRGPANLGSINGERVTEEQLANAQREMLLQYFFRNGRWPDEATMDQLRQEAYKWLLMIQKQEQMGIHVSDADAAETAKRLLIPFEQRGPIPVLDFVQQVLEPRGLQLADLERFCRHYLGIQELMSTVGIGGRLLTPQEVRAIYERRNQEVATEAAVFSATNYLSKVAVTPQAVTEFYTNEMPNYRIPERVQVKYVEVGVSNFLSQAQAELSTNLDAMVQTNFQQLGTNYTLYGKTPDEAKATIREKLIRFKALDTAKKQARDFANELLNKDHITPGDLEALAAAKGLKVGTTTPFDRESPPKELSVGQDFAKAAFSRTADDPFAGPFVGENGAYELGFYKQLPSENPPLEQIRDRVVADYKFSQAVNLARKSGMDFYAVMTNGMGQGKSFSAVVTEAKQPVLTLPPFAMSTREVAGLPEGVTADQLKQVAFSLQPGTASRFQYTSDGGMILYVKAKLPVDETRMRTEIPRFTEQLRQEQIQDAFNLWFSKEAEKGLVDTPLFQQRPPTMGAAAKS